MLMQRRSMISYILGNQPESIHFFNDSETLAEENTHAFTTDVISTITPPNITEIQIIDVHNALTSEIKIARLH